MKGQAHMKIHVFKSLLTVGINAVALLGSGIWAFSKRLYRNKTLWSGLIPTALLAIVAFWALQKTGDQLRLLQEQISYVRQPVLHVYSRPIDTGDWRNTKMRLYVGNVGNETVENVMVRVWLFLVNERDIYSWGQFKYLKAYSTDTLRGPKERLWPHGALAPNEERDIQDWVYHALLRAFLTIPSGEQEVNRELGTVADLLAAQFVLFVECVYRRRTDRREYADTTFLDFSLWFTHMPPEDLRFQIGGVKLIERMKGYLREGPQLSVNIREDSYEIFRHAFGSHPTAVKTIPRKR
jgi:hypothetical protein